MKNMDKKQLHISLLFLMKRLEESRKNPMCEKSFIAALAEVLRYFRDNGELKEAYKQRTQFVIDWCGTSSVDAFYAKLRKDNPEVTPIDMGKAMEKLSSDEFIEDKIKEIL